MNKCACLAVGFIGSILGISGLSATRAIADPGSIQPADHAMWQIPAKFQPAQLVGEEWVRPQKYQPVILDKAQLTTVLQTAPLEFTARGQTARTIITIPMPDGSFQRFSIVESPVMEAALALQFPDIKTYSGFGVDDPWATIRLDNTPLGFHSQILSPFGAAYIDPVTRKDTVHYAAYYKQDLVREGGFRCGTVDVPSPVENAVTRLAKNMRDDKPAPLVSTSGTMKSYRIAICATGEYTAAQGTGTVADGLAAIVALVNRISGVYEVDFAVHLNLVASEANVIFTNAATDPFTAPTNPTTSNTQCQTTLNNPVYVGTANYDVGHVVYKPAAVSGNNGLAGGIGTVCGNSKGQGYSAVTPATGDAMAIDYVAHELGHQFGGRHNFNSCGGSMGDSSTYAVEPGSGISIMGYAGICGVGYDLDAHSIADFNSINIEQIVAYVSGATGSGCAVVTSTGNTAPSVNPGSNYTIPYKTPFTLTASATDPNSDPITYSWEERDTSTASAPSGLTADNGAYPLCRPFLPTPDPTRTVPNINSLVNNSPLIGETLPQVARSMKWRVVARDNKGGVDIQPTGSTYITLTVVNTGAPFAVTSPNTAVSYTGGTTQTVTWNVVGTNAGSINCANVAILLSTDGGFNFNTVLAASVPNNGSANVTLPNISTTTARIKVAAVGNIFFDISDTNFTITAQPTGACCAPVGAGGGCTTLTSGDCLASGGDYKGDGIGCDPTPCVIPTGACCFHDGSCLELTSTDCAAQSGAYRADNSTCPPSPVCPLPTGACCDPTTGLCSTLTHSQCGALTQNYLGDDIACSSANPCPPPVGACCDPSANCTLVSSAACAAAQGVYFGDNQACIDHPCPGPGACCKGATCTLVANSLFCNGYFVGADTLCNASGNFKTPCCKADFNQSGTVTVQDLFDFLAAWFSHTSSADINNSGVVTTQDLFDFLNAWFAKCG